MRGNADRIRKATKTINAIKMSLKQDGYRGVEKLVAMSTSGTDPDARQAAILALDALTQLQGEPALDRIKAVAKAVWSYRFATTGVSYTDTGEIQSTGKAYGQRPVSIP
jgi:hypothetical protein